MIKGNTNEKYVIRDQSISPGKHDLTEIKLITTVTIIGKQNIDSFLTSDFN